jgi:integrase
MPGGKLVWQVDCGQRNGKRLRRQFASAAEARVYLADTQRERRQIGALAVGLTAADRIDAVRARMLLPVNVTLEAAADFFVQHAAPMTAPVTFIPSPGASAEVNATNGKQWQRWADWLTQRSKTPATATAADATEFAHQFQGRGKTWRHYRATLARVYRLAGRTNPSDTVNVLGTPRARRALTLDECQRLLQAAAGEWRTAVCLALYTGARLGDVVTLTHGAVDRTVGLIRLQPAKTRGTSGARCVVPIHPALLAELPAPGTGPLLPDLAERYARSRYAVAHALTRLFRRAKIADASFHCLRHTFISRLAESGAPAELTRELVGHTSAAMTRHYTHVALDVVRAAVARLPSVA